jgi:quercetin dioxygenase-like cupin family protein
MSRFDPFFARRKKGRAVPPPEHAAAMKILRAGQHQTRRGPKEYFAGTVWLNDVATSAARVKALHVSFEPGARTAWHTHPHGQTLHILSGVGRVQRAGESRVEVFPGDSIWFEPGERHWHGANPDSTMVHLAIQEPDAGGSTTTWLEQVTDAEYSA